MRLDKFLAHGTGYSRTDVKKFLKQNQVKIDGAVITSPGFQVDLAQCVVTLFDEEVIYQKHVYLMMNKPTGYLSATKDGKDVTVMDLIDEYYHRFDLSIAGRLDKDTEGLLILTNDGQFLHQVISPKKRIYKKYLAHIEGELTAEAMEKLTQGVTIKDGKNVPFKTQAARVHKIDENMVEIEICEGKFHQVRRMFASVDCFVVDLKRLAIGNLQLDPYLELGECRELESEELMSLMTSTH